MPFLDVAKGLLDAGKALLDAEEALRRQDQQARERTATCLDAIVTCLEHISAHARDQDHAALAGRCQELGIFLDNFVHIDGLPELLGANRGDLVRALADSVNASKGSQLVSTLSTTTRTREEAITQVERATGAFRASSALLRALQSGKAPSEARTTERTFGRWLRVVSKQRIALLVALCVLAWAVYNRKWLAAFVYTLPIRAHFFACDREFVEFTARVTKAGAIELSATNHSVICDARVSTASVFRLDHPERSPKQRLQRELLSGQSATETLDCTSACQGRRVVWVEWVPLIDKAWVPLHYRELNVQR